MTFANGEEMTVSNMQLGWLEYSEHSVLLDCALPMLLCNHWHFCYGSDPLVSAVECVTKKGAQGNHHYAIPLVPKPLIGWHSKTFLVYLVVCFDRPTF